MTRKPIAGICYVLRINIFIQKLPEKETINNTNTTNDNLGRIEAPKFPFSKYSSFKIIILRDQQSNKYYLDMQEIQPRTV